MTEAELAENGFYKYSLPKGFVFPKWEKGKEQLKTPDTDY
jgi:hypothetical protein